jgi:hypothetical protein
MANKQQPRETKNAAPIKDAAKLRAIISAISKLDSDDLEKNGAWSELDALSSHTIFEGVEAHPNGIFSTGEDRFEAVATVYVTLNYGSHRDETSMSDSYPATVAGIIGASNKPKIESITVDTSSFYQ